MGINRVTVTADHLVVEPTGFNKVWSFTRRLQFPLERVRGATLDPGRREVPRGRRGPGLGLPGKLAGTFRADGKKQFWNVSGYDGAIVVALDDAERFDRLVLTVDDPNDVVNAINSAVGAR